MQTNRAKKWQRAIGRVVQPALLLAALQACSPTQIPLCDKPTAQVYQGAYLMFDAENANKLSQMILDIQAGKCRVQ